MGVSNPTRRREYLTPGAGNAAPGGGGGAGTVVNEYVISNGVLVLGADESVPDGTPADTVIVRRTSID